MQLFRGRTDAYGTGKGGWVHRSPEYEDFVHHLEGQGHGIGIAPLLDDGTVSFAAIDLDEPNFAAAKEMQQMLGFATTWIEESRSGNAHVWAFFREPIDAWIPRGIFRETTAAIGKPTIEIFPKQDKLLEGMVGNYINLPYHGNARPILADSGEHLPRFDFLEKALISANDLASWRKRADWLSIAPPEQRERDSVQHGTAKELHKCAEYIIANRDENPIAEGHRNVVYFNLAKMLTHYEGFDHDEAWDLLCKVRDSATEKGVDSVADSELRRILSNAERGGFTSTGCDDPLMQPYIHPECPIARQ
jgi:hypothetical protein